MNLRRESGQALVESILLGLVLLVPIAWSLGVLSELHRAALATTAAVREAGFEAARSRDDTQAAAAIDRAVAIAMINHELDPTHAEVRWSIPEGLRRGDIVEVVASYQVSVAQLPILGDAGGPGVRVTSRHIARIDPYGSRR
jgi:hypothetical protein